MLVPLHGSLRRPGLTYNLSVNILRAPDRRREAGERLVRGPAGFVIRTGRATVRAKKNLIREAIQMNTLIQQPDEALASPLPLRDLDEAAFYARYACDRFTAAILGNRFRYVMKHMATKLRTNAFSPVIRDMDDFCTTLSGPPELGWPMPAASLTNPIHWGPIADSVPIVLQEHGLDKLKPGDLIVANDSYRTGKHLNDTSFIRPLFCEGRLIGAVHITAHQLDIGARVAGGFDIKSQSLWEDGLVLTPMLLYRAGVPERSTFNLIAANTRYPEMILADLQVIRASLDLGEDLLLESIQRYGLDAYIGAIRYASDAASEAMSQAVQAIPDGDYFGEERIDSDGLPDSPEYFIRVKVAKRAHRLEFDFSGTSQAARTAMGCSWLDVKTGVLMALKLLFDRRSSPSSGGMRNVDILIPFGSMVNPQPPAPTMFYFTVVESIIVAVLNALNPAMKENAIACGSGSNSLHHGRGKTLAGEPWAIPAIASGVGGQSWGATSAGDADSFSLVSWTNFPQTGVEVKELDAPITVMRSEAAIDTGGVGYNRGGAGHLIDVKWMHGGMHHCYTTQVRTGPRGGNGGKPGSAGGAWIFDPEVTGYSRREWLPADLSGELYLKGKPMSGMLDPKTNELSQAGEYVFMRDELYASHESDARHITNAGGGWGDALAREPERVLIDVRDGYVSVAGAARDYGVAVLGDPDKDPEGLAIDEAATRALRARR
jgi:N-methylhydantoinase B